MFYGEYSHSLDEKGRIIVPSRIRDAMKECGDSRFMITRGLDQCLSVFSQTEWDRYVKKLRSLSMNKKNARSYARVLFSGASEFSVDKQGRAFLPQKLREHAGITKDVAVIGVEDRIEIWDQATWEAFSKESMESFEDTAENLGWGEGG